MGVIIGFLIGLVGGAGVVTAGLILQRIEEMGENDRIELLKGKNQVKRKQKNKRG